MGTEETAPTGPIDQQSDTSDKSQGRSELETGRRRSGLGLVSFVIALIAGAVSCTALISAIALVDPANVDPDDPIARTLVRVIMGVFVLTTVGIVLGIAGLLQENRQRTYAVLGIVFGLLVFVGWAAVRAVNLSEPRSTARQFTLGYSELIGRCRQLHQQDGTPSADEQFFSDMRVACELEALRVEAPLDALFIELASFYEQGLAPIEEWSASAAAMESAGGFDFVILLDDASKSSLTDHVRRIDRCKAARSALEESETLAHANFRKRLIDRGLDAELVDYACNTLSDATTSEQQDRIRGCDETAFAAGSDALTLLLDHWGEWHVDKAAGVMSFDNPRHRRRWEDYMDTLFDARREQRGLIQRLLAESDEG